MVKIRWAVALVVVCLAAAVVWIVVGRTEQPQAADVPAPTEGVVLEDGWVRATMDTPESAVSALFGVLRNGGDRDLVLTSAETSISSSTTAQRRTEIVDGVPQFEDVAQLVVPAHSTLTLDPTALRLGLIDASKVVEPGATVYVSLTFDDGSTLDTAVQARAFEEIDLAGGYWHGDHYHPEGDYSHGVPPGLDGSTAPTP